MIIKRRVGLVTDVMGVPIMIECRYCDLEFYDNQDRADHERKIHLEPIRCEDCGIIHPNMSCYEAEKEFGKKVNL